jgi:hypothetical protein
MTSSDTLSAARVPRWRRCRLPGRARKQKPPASLDLISGECLSSAIAPGLYRPPSYSLDALRADLNRFTFLLGEDPPNARNRLQTAVTFRERKSPVQPPSAVRARIWPIFRALARIP